MQIAENVYLDIKVKSNKFLNLSKSLSFDNLKDFIMVETAGTSLPYICFSFFTTDKELIEYFIENNKVEVTLGNTAQDAETFTMNLFATPKDTDPSGNTATISASGFLGDNAYMVDRGKCKAYTGNSLMAVRQILSKYKGLKGIETDITRVDEKQMIWRQLYKTSASFLVEVLLHMNIQPSFPLFTFDKYGKFYLKDYKKVVKAGAVHTFTPYQPNKGEIQYLNNFNIDSFKPSYNLYSGYNKITEIYGVETGMPGYTLAENTPILSSTNISEKSRSGHRISLNKTQTANVHDTYYEAFAYNSNKLVALSSMQGVLQLMGYYPTLRPTDLVYVKTPTENGMISSMEGLYIIDTIVISPSFKEGIVTTYVYVTRDNNNNIENFVAQKSYNLNIKIPTLKELLNAIAKTRTALAVCSQAIDGTYISSVNSYITSLKTELLRSFSIDGTIIDLNSQLNFLQSSLCLGNTLMNTLLNMLFPESIASSLKDFLIEKPTVRGVIGKYIEENVPMQIQGIISELIDSIFLVYESLNSISEDNGVTPREIKQVPIQPSDVTDEEIKIEEIILDFENNTVGLDIPFPIINLTESQKLLPEKELRDYLADETINNLTNLGYLSTLTEDEKEEFKEILLGETPISYSIINRINEAAGDKLNYRFWGTYGATNEPLYAWTYGDEKVYTKSEDITQYAGLYNDNYTPYTEGRFVVARDGYTDEYKVMYMDMEPAERNEEEDITTDALSQLTNYYIMKGYKDRYRTLPCTKIINAQRNARLYFACPQTERNIKFYINSRRMELKSFPMNLGYTDAYGNPIMYNVFYTTVGYNSNSTVLEIRQG